MDKKVRRPFKIIGWERILTNGDGVSYHPHPVIGHGVYYPYGGNVQAYFQAHGYAAWQFHSIAEVLQFKGVKGIVWDQRF